MDVTVNGQRSREPLGTTDWREARAIENRRVIELAKRPPDPTNRRRTFGSLNIGDAIAVYADERRSQVSPRMVAVLEGECRTAEQVLRSNALTQYRLRVDRRLPKRATGRRPSPEDRQR